MTCVATRALLLVVLPALVGAGCVQRSSPPPPPPTSSTVTAEDLDRQPGQPIEEVLMSRFPGVIVTRTAGGVSVRIRGTTSIYGSKEPLYVIDGVEIQAGPDGALNGINPHDIESIEGLK